MRGDLVRGGHAVPSQQVRDRWAVLVMIMAWGWICVPKLIQTVLSPKYRVALGGEAPYSKIAALADYAFYYGLIGVVGLVVIVFINDLPHQGGLRLLCLLAPWAYMVIRDIYVPVKPSELAILYPLVVIALWITRPRFPTVQWLGYLIGATALISVVLAVVLPSHAIFQTQSGELIADDKQFLPIGVLVGIFSQGNTLGQFLVLGLPAVVMISRRPHRLVLVAATVIAIVWSASRGAQIAGGVGLLGYGLYLWARGGARRVMLWVAPIAMFAVVAAVPFLTTDTRAFANRGLIWILSLRAWSEQVWVGYGINWYDVIGNSSSRIAGSARHGHNQLVQLLVTGGMVMVLLVVLLVWVTNRLAVRMGMAGNLFGSVWVLMLGASGLFERTLGFVDNPNFLVTATIPFALLMFSTGALAPPVRELGSRRARSATSATPARTTHAPYQLARSYRNTTSSGPAQRSVSRNPKAPNTSSSA